MAWFAASIVEYEIASLATGPCACARSPQALRVLVQRDASKGTRRAGPLLLLPLYPKPFTRRCQRVLPVLVLSVVPQARRARGKLKYCALEYTVAVHNRRSGIRAFQKNVGALVDTCR